MSSHSLVPRDIVMICLYFYDKILHWNIESADLRKHLESVDEDEDGLTDEGDGVQF